MGDGLRRGGRVKQKQPKTPMEPEAYRQGIQKTLEKVTERVMT